MKSFPTFKLRTSTFEAEDIFPYKSGVHAVRETFLA